MASFGGRCICALLVVPFGEEKRWCAWLSAVLLTACPLDMLQNFDACFWLLGEWYVNKCPCQWVTGLYPREVSSSA